MDAIERVKELIEEIAPFIKDEYPNYTNALIRIDSDGFMALDVMRWAAEPEPVEKRKRRELLELRKHVDEGVWGTDCSNSQNNYYAKCGCLLREDK